MVAFVVGMTFGGLVSFIVYAILAVNVDERKRSDGRESKAEENAEFDGCGCV